MSFELLIEERALEELTSLQDNVQQRIKKKIKEVLKSDPYPDGKGDIKKIKDSDIWRLRVGDHRVFYDVEDRTVYILSIKHRSNAYDDL